MKHLLLTLSLFSATITKSQIVDTTMGNITAIAIEPVYAKFTDSVPVSRLGVRIISDNLLTECQLYYELLDSNGAVQLNGNMTISGDDYKGWDGNNEFPFLFVASRLGLGIILNEE